ncbi:MAG: DUF2169 domain-containing protein [Thermoguttaceae bacterium]
MDLENLTAFPARAMVGFVASAPPSFASLTRTKHGLPPEFRVQGLLVVKCTLEYNGKTWAPAAEQIPIWEQDQEGPPYFEKDVMFQKGGLDLAIMGHARAPGKPVPKMTVSVSIGAWSHRLVVFGSRQWNKRFSRFAPSDPEPFQEISLTLEHAFGGTTLDHEGHAVPWPLNPDGMGFTMPNKNSQIEGVALPHIEDPAHLITGVDDKPEPVGFALLPFTNGLRLRAGVRPRPDATVGPPVILPRLHNAAFPGMILPHYPSGEEIMVEGMTTRSPWAARLPAFPAQAELQDEDRATTLTLEPDTLCIFMDQQRLYITAKGRFDYDLEKPPRLTAVVRPAARR